MDTKERILKLRNKGWSTAKIAERVGCTPGNVRYYLNRYGDTTPVPITHIKYDLEVGLSILHSWGDQTLLDDLLRRYNMPHSSAYTLYKRMKALPDRREVIEVVGHFNPMSTSDCWAVGLSYNTVRSALDFLEKNRLFVVFVGDDVFLEARVRPSKKRIPLTLQQQVALLGNPKGWITSNAGWIKDAWKRVPRKMDRRTEKKLLEQITVNGETIYEEEEQ